MTLNPSDSGKYKAFRNIAEAHLEVANICNLSCSYCYATGSRLNGPSLMPLSVAYRFIEQILNSTSSKTVHLVFHGGEPLLQTSNWLRNVLAYSYRLAKTTGKAIRFEMQSNLTLLDDEKLDIIKEYGVMIGTSLDGPFNVNDSVRGSGKLVLENIRKLKELNCFGGIICVLGRHNYDKSFEIMKFFEMEGIQNVDWLIGYSVGKGASLPSLSSDELFQGFKGIYQYLENSGGNAVVERNVAGKISRFLKPPTQTDFKEILVCNHPLCGAGITINLCDSNGDIFPCGCAVCNSNSILGNINEFDDDSYIHAVTEFQNNHRIGQEKCHQCSALVICRSGCAAFGPMDPSTADSECNAMKLLFDFLGKQPENLLREIDSSLRRNR